MYISSIIRDTSTLSIAIFYTINIIMVTDHTSCISPSNHNTTIIMAIFYFSSPHISNHTSGI